MKTAFLRSVFCLFTFALIASISQAQISLLAVGTLDKSRAGDFQDLSGLTYPLENGVRANELGGFGSAITQCSRHHQHGRDRCTSQRRQQNSFPRHRPSAHANNIAPGNIPAKIEGISFGPAVRKGRTTLHTLWVANDNDFLETVPDATGNLIPNDNQFFVFGFTDADLAGSVYAPQHVRSLDF